MAVMAKFALSAFNNPAKVPPSGQDSRFDPLFTLRCSLGIRSSSPASSFGPCNPTPTIPAAELNTSISLLEGGSCIEIFVRGQFLSLLPLYGWHCSARLQLVKPS